MNQLIQSLLARGLVSEEQIKEARIKQVGAKKSLQELLVDMGFLSEADLLGVAAEALRMPVVTLEKDSIDPLAAQSVPYELAKRFGVFPVRREGDTLFLAMSLGFFKGLDRIDLKAPPGRPQRH
jgi:type IV pilus assembly protein PilB